MKLQLVEETIFGSNSKYLSMILKIKKWIQSSFASTFFGETNDLMKPMITIYSNSQIYISL